jgi:hypothetical protein
MLDTSCRSELPPCLFLQGRRHSCPLLVHVNAECGFKDDQDGNSKKNKYGIGPIYLTIRWRFTIYSLYSLIAGSPHDQHPPLLKLLCSHGKFSRGPSPRQIRTRFGCIRGRVHRADQALAICSSYQGSILASSFRETNGPGIGTQSLGSDSRAVVCANQSPRYMRV